MYSPGGTPYKARVVLYDPETDVAVLDVTGLNATPLISPAGRLRRTDGIVAGYPLSHPFTAVPATIGSDFTASGPDIYQTGSVNRQIYDIKAQIQPGNSGGPLLSTSGLVYGSSAASTNEVGTGYALTASQVAQDVQQGFSATRQVSTEGCQDG